MNEVQLSNLMQQQNNLLEQQNKLLQQLIDKKKESVSSTDLLDGEQILVRDLFNDEIRDGFLVNAHRKRLWNVLLNIVVELDRICKKHDIRYFAIVGTLLGAVRHKGFIPWDDDLDIIMLRPDYEKFKSVIEDELKDNPNYSMWYWFNYHLETDPENTPQAIRDLPFISKEQMDKYPGWAPFFPLLRLLDERTTYLMRDGRKNVFYAVWLDILCLDPCPPFQDKRSLNKFRRANEILSATVFPERTKASIESGKKFLTPPAELAKFLELPYKIKAQLFDNFMARTFAPSRYTYKAKNFENVIYLPFETIEIPAPADYDEVLTDRYGDWHEIPSFHKKHVNVFSADVSYKKYFEQIKSIPLLKK